MLLDDLKETMGYRKLKEEELDGILWRTDFGRGYISIHEIRLLYVATSVRLVACQQQSFLETADGNGHNHKTSC